MKRLLTFFLFATIGSLCEAQMFSGKTNGIVLNYNNPINPSLTTDLAMVKWVTPQQKYTNTQNTTIEIEADITSEFEIKSIKLMVSDGSTPRGEKPIELGNGKTVQIKQSIKLFHGQNVIELRVETISGGTISSSRSILVGNDAGTMAIDRKDYVLLFATNQYDNWTNLVNPIDDAQSVAKVLKEKYGFETEIVLNPTTDQVFNKLRDYAERKFKPQDQLMIFFAGHGYFDDTFGEGFVVAKNSLKNDRAKTSFISHSRLRGVIQNIPTEHILLVMDVCFGGTFDPVIASTRGLGEPKTIDVEFLLRKLSQRTRKYITSGGKEYVSDGIPGKHSPFTLKLLQALTDGGGNDGILTLSKIKTYVEKLQPEPRLGSFGDDKPESDFMFVNKN